ncbi:MAG: aldehyde dehydrogenase family protein, partial [Phycisphaeraceae bacterium]
SGATFEQRNPANLEEVTGTWPACTRDDAKRAIAAARDAYPAWRAMGVYKRAEYLKRALALMMERREPIARVLTAENGKTLNESLTEIDAAIKEMEFQISEGLRLGGTTVATGADGVFAYQTRVPLGVVSIISPWNFPFNVPGRKGTPALMAGNTVVFKPASLTPGVGLEFTKLMIDAGLPEGVWNFVTGGGSTVGEEFTTHPEIKAISFTGSTDVGMRINQKASENLIRTQLELGGKNPLIILDDADLAAAALSAVTGAFACAGQWCTSTSRVIVTDAVADEVVEKIVAGARKLKPGPGTDESTTLGPVCGQQQLESILAYIRLGKEEGATLLTGGGQPDDPALANGCFIEPTVFDHVRPEMRIAREEIFGPVLSIIRVKDFERAMRVANDVEFGLSSSIYTNDLSKTFAFLEQTDVGLAHVNMVTAYKEPQLSFGGVKASGFGVPEAGETGIEFFSEHKVAYVKHR